MGIIIVSIGFTLWYVRHQRYQDALLAAETKKAMAEALALGGATVTPSTRRP
jgi:hypothetical protein